MINMRLSSFEINTIKNSAKKYFGDDVQVLLFGSRVDDNKRGGDIDLYIISPLTNNIYQQKIKFLVELQSLLGEQKIDVLIASDNSRLIEQSALNTGIVL
ncbi:MAG: nucleotidyltransferase domain-containing protein [Methylococcaceae bacterium]